MLLIDIDVFGFLKYLDLTGLLIVFFEEEHFFSWFHMHNGSPVVR